MFDRAKVIINCAMFLRRRIFFAKIKKLVQAFVKLKKKCIFAPDMRYFTFIFSLYLLVLTGVPCADMPIHEGENTDFQLVATHDDTPSHLHLDVCSPFCVCTCCQVLVDSFSFNTFTIEAPIETIHPHSLPLYTEVWVSAYYGNIWTPPKV